jgi:alkanesulfonate monooxygenase SsuD/methylene tetrahydromethanopterin reductase-like flavin-dependent oxidoreductase (luciferase family)
MASATAIEVVVVLREVTVVGAAGGALDRCWLPDNSQMTHPDASAATSPRNLRRVVIRCNLPAGSPCRVLTMELALMTEPQRGGTYDDLLAAARLAESSGLACLARSDHYYYNREPGLPATDAFATMAGLARETLRIRLGIMVSPITFRHPAVLAKSAATIDQMSSGRFDIGVGTGWMEVEHEVFGIPFPPLRQRFAMLEESLQYLRSAFAGTSFRGNHYRLTAEAFPRPQGVRLLVGGSGVVRTPTLAGHFADEYNLFVSTPKEIASRVATMRAAARAAGRDPGNIAVSLMGPVIIGETEADYRRLLAAEADRRDMPVKEFEARVRNNGVPAGSTAEVARQLVALEEVGISRFYLQWFDLTDREGMRNAVVSLQRAHPS